MPVYRADNYSDPMPSNPGVGVCLTREFEFLVGTALAINDTIELCPLAQGLAIVFDEWFFDCPDLDTNACPVIVLDLGDNDTSAKFLSASDAGLAGGLRDSMQDGVAGSTPVSYIAGNNNDFLLTVTTGPATGATAVTIRGWIRYHFSGITPIV